MKSAEFLRAFPIQWTAISGAVNGYDGMSLRDYFAAKAMQALMTNTETMIALSKAAQNAGEADGFALTARKAYEAADAMVEARK